MRGGGIFFQIWDPAICGDNFPIEACDRAFSFGCEWGIVGTAYRKDLTIVGNGRGRSDAPQVRRAEQREAAWKVPGEKHVVVHLVVW